MGSSEFPNAIKKYSGFGTSIDVITFDFVKSHVPQELMDEYNIDYIVLISGEFPEDGSDEILVPDVYILLKADSEDFDSVINRKVPLGINSEDGQHSQKTYTISGVYNTNYRNTIGVSYFIYTAYFSEDLQSSYLTDESYDYYKNALSTNDVTREFNEKIIGSYERYTKAVGTGNSMMIIRADESKYVSDITNALNELYPYYHVVSQEDLKRGELSSVYSSLVIILIAELLIAFLNKGYINGRSKEMSILYSLGYKKSDILFIITIENTILYIFYYIIACILTYFANKIFFSKTAYYQWVSIMFDPTNLSMIFSLILVILSISIIWGIHGVKQSNLKKYLNE